MADRYPKSIEEMTAENAQLRALSAQQQSSIGSLQARLVAQDAELARLRNPKKPPRALDKDAVDAFQRPAYSR